jgi:hypothetical protein
VSPFKGKYTIGTPWIYARVEGRRDMGRPGKLSKPIVKKAKK